MNFFCIDYHDFCRKGSVNLTKTAYGQACPILKNQGIPASRPVFSQEELLFSVQELRDESNIQKT
jgi:hypothetical protein